MLIAINGIPLLHSEYTNRSRTHLFLCLDIPRQVFCIPWRKRQIIMLRSYWKVSSPVEITGPAATKAIEFNVMGSSCLQVKTSTVFIIN